MTTASTAKLITMQVCQFYEAFPYPHYPLILKPKWQQGYLGSSLFSQSLVHGSHTCSLQPHVLLSGAGEIQSYMIRKWEPAGHLVTAVDLSKRSLRRSHIRQAFSLKKARLVQDDIGRFLHESEPGSLTHIEAYGMLHHLPNPSVVMAGFARGMTAGATMRMMVYNSEARDWLHQIQKVFKLLKIDPYSVYDRQYARNFLQQTARILPRLQHYLDQLGSVTFRNNARFVDTFLHPHELHWSAAQWWDLLKQNSLTPIGLFDRYGELDDLSNPLWCMPTLEELQPRIADARFENNFELFLVKQGTPNLRLRQASRVPMTLRYAQPPRLWFSFSETSMVPVRMRQQLWSAYLDFVFRGRCMPRETMSKFKKVDISAIQRLARLGAIFPQQITDPDLHKQIRQPMAEAMQPPSRPPPTTVDGTAVTAMLQKRLSQISSSQQQQKKSLQNIIIRLGKI